MRLYILTKVLIPFMQVMKMVLAFYRLPVLVQFLLLLLVFSPLSAYCAEQLQPVAIESISYNLEPDERESIIFKLSGPAEDPNVFLLNGGNPRLVIDFPGTFYKGENIVPVGGSKLAHGIRVGAHLSPVMKTRVVIDLSTRHDAKYERLISDEGTVLTIFLSPIFPEEVEKTAKTVDAAVKITVEEESGVTKVETDEPVEPVLVEKDPSPGGAVVVNDLDRDSQLLEISFDSSSNKGEMVIFHLNDFYPPTVSAIEEETPRVFCDFMDMKLGADVNEVILAKGKYVERIRTALHKDPDKVRVVLDLSPDKDYDLQQVFFRNDNLFVLIVNELPVEVVSD